MTKKKTKRKSKDLEEFELEDDMFPAYEGPGISAIMYCRDCGRYIKNENIRFKKGTSAVLCIFCEAKERAEAQMNENLKKIFTRRTMKQKLEIITKILRS